MISAARLCLVCKGSRALCGHQRCPLLARVNLAPRISRDVGKDFFGPSPNIFVGRIGYPDVNIGPLASIEARPDIDSPASWLSRDYSEIIELRSLLIRSKQKENISSRSRLVSEVQELALAGRPTEIEMGFKKKPVYRVSFSDMVQPMGPSAPLEKLRITENPSISRRVDKIVSDELRASEAGFLLYRKGEDVYRVTTILSSGALGLEAGRKMVPTRWSITATDDMVFRELIRGVKDFPSVNEFLVYSSRYLDNHFQILLMPGQWEYENFEAWAPGSFWFPLIDDSDKSVSRHTPLLKGVEILEEYEPYRGRTKYADLEGGGYYAARLGVIEGLTRIRRQARVVVFREIYEGYVVPLGVWVVRETARSAFRGQPERFPTLEQALAHISSRLRIPVAEYRKRSRILGQKRLGEFG